MSFPFEFLLVSYLCGSVPSSYIVGKVFFKEDLRNLGSGNLGTTNALRMFGKKAASVVLVIDVMKGFLPTWYISERIGILDAGHWVVLCGLVAIVGHIYSCWVRFSGGKGVATRCGVFLALTPLATFCAIVVWFIVFAIKRTASIASLACSILFPVAVYFDPNNQQPILVWFSLGLSVLILWTHRSNIIRMIEGKEKPAL